MHRTTALSFFLAATAAAGSARAQWSVVPTPNSPSGRTDAACAFHLGSGATVLFGGAGVSPFALRADTWTYDGSDWTQATPNSSPTGRFGMAMVHDLARNRCVMFGGISSLISIALPNNQTWEWDGTDWTQATPAASPTGRAHYGLAYDLLRQRVVMYGGTTNPGLLITSNETWEYNGITWTQVAQATAANPGPRQYPGMAFHQATGRTVLFGGINPQTGGNSDTWLFDGTAWTLAPNAGAVPAPRSAPKLAYDLGRAAVLMQGGSVPSTGAPIDETWDWNGAGWQRLLVPQPSSRSRSHLAYDTLRSRMVLWGGATQNNQGPTDTYEFGPFTTEIGPGCAGGGGVPQLGPVTAPKLGTTFVTNLSQLAPWTTFGAIAAGFSTYQPSLPLDAQGLTGCALHVQVQALVFLPAVGGVITAQIPIPYSAGLLGVQLSQQGLSLDAPANPAGMVVSNAITAVLGW
jgi:hypothetical protein